MAEVPISFIGLGAGGGALSSDTTATKDDVLQGKTAITSDSNNIPIEGTIPTQTTNTLSVNAGQSQSLPTGYYPNGVTATGTSLVTQTPGNAIPRYLLQGQIAWVNGAQISGAMPLIETNATLNAGQVYTIPEGYQPGAGKVTANSLASQTVGNATTAQVLRDYVVWSNGARLVGTMPNLSRESTINYNSTNATKVIPGDAVFRETNSDGVNRFLVRYNSGSGYIMDNTLFGVPSTMLGNATQAQVLAGRTFTSGAAGPAAAGTMVNRGAVTGAVSLINTGGYLYYRIQTGAYITPNGNIGYPEITATQGSVANAIGLNASKIVQGNIILGIAGTGPTWNSYYLNDSGDIRLPVGGGWTNVLRVGSVPTGAGEVFNIKYELSTNYNTESGTVGYLPILGGPRFTGSGGDVVVQLNRTSEYIQARLVYRSDSTITQIVVKFYNESRVFYLYPAFPR